MARRIFLSHNSKDKPKVRKIAERLHNDPDLKAAGFEVFLDEWHLVPGRDLLKELESAIKGSCVAVCFQGPYGDGPYQSEEIGSLLRRSAKGNCRVVPVLLRGAKEEQLDGFLGNRLAVKYSGRGAYERLVAGILDRAPGPPSRTKTNKAAVAKTKSTARPVRGQTPKKKSAKAKSKPKKLVPAKSKSKGATIKTTKQRSTVMKSQRITSSGNLILLGDQFYSCISYKESSSGNFGGSEIVVVIRVGAAALVKLKPALSRGSSLSYTYQNTSGTGSVRDYLVETRGRSTTVALTLTNSHQNVNPSLVPAYSDGTRRLSANDIAHLAAKDILLNQPMDSILWAFFGNSLHYRPRAPGSPLATYMTRVTPEKLRKASVGRGARAARPQNRRRALRVEFYHRCEGGRGSLRRSVTRLRARGDCQSFRCVWGSGQVISVDRWGGVYSMRANEKLVV